MGFIKAIGTATSGQYGDQFREVIKCDNLIGDIIAERVTTENQVITDQSRLFVQPGQCAIYIDNGSIKDIITEPGMYFMDTSAPTLFQTNIFKGIGQNILETLKRVAYKGEEINQQFVYFISLTEKIGMPFTTQQRILFDDPEWGPIELIASGQYGFKIVNPVNLLANVIGSNQAFGVSNVSYVVMPYIIASITTEIANLNVSFEEITKKQDSLGDKLIKSVTEKLENLGIEITRAVVTNIDVTDEVKESMRERVAIKMKATSVDEKEVDTYTKLQQAEAMKDLANNPNSAGATVMGMNVGNMFGGVLTGKDEDKKA